MEEGETPPAGRTVSVACGKEQGQEEEEEGRWEKGLSYLPDHSLSALALWNGISEAVTWFNLSSWNTKS